MSKPRRVIDIQSGFTLIEMIIGLAISLTLTGFAGVMIVQVFSQNGDLNAQAASGISEMEAVQAIHSNRTLRKLLDISSQNGIEDCLSEGGVSCKSFQSSELKSANIKSAQLDRYIGGGGTCGALTESCPYDREVFYRWKCSQDNSCEGVDVIVRISRYQFESGEPGLPKKPILKKKRESKFFVSSFDIAMAPSVNYENCEGKMVVGIDYKNKKAICQERTENIECNGFSVVGMGSAACGKAPGASSTNICSLQLYKSSSGLTMKYSASSGDATRIAFRCTRKGSTTGDVKNIVYFGAQNGTQNIPINPGSVTVKCDADLRGEGKAPLANCSASYSYTEPPSSASDGGSGTGSGNGGSGSTKSKTTTTTGTTKVKQSVLTSKVKGSGASFSGGIKTVKK